MTTVHAEGFSFYQIGFRCCSDVPSTAPSKGTTQPPTNRNVPSTNPPPGAIIGT
jgi:hypothetical protein